MITLSDNITTLSFHYVYTYSWFSQYKHKKQCFSACSTDNGLKHARKAQLIWIKLDNIFKHSLTKMFTSKQIKNNFLETCHLIISKHPWPLRFPAPHQTLYFFHKRNIFFYVIRVTVLLPCVVYMAGLPKSIIRLPIQPGNHQVSILFQWSCQWYKIGYQLLSSRCMPNYTKTCSFLHAHYTETQKVVEKFVKNLFNGEKHSFNEWTYVVGAHWNCLYEAISNGYQQHMLLKLRKPILKYTLSKYHVHWLSSFKHLKQPISIKIPVNIWQILYIYMTAISPNFISWTVLLLSW